MDTNKDGKLSSEEVHGPLKNDIEIANYVVQDHRAGSSVMSHNHFIIAVPALFSPWENHFTFIMGPGIEL